MYLDRRAFLQLSVLALAGCGGVRRAAPFDAIVSTDPADSALGIPCYASVGAALAAAPQASARAWRIRIARGRWHEKLVVAKPNIQLIGDAREKTILAFDAAAGHLKPDGKPWGTWGCASVIVRAPDFSARNLTIENSFDYIGEITRPRPTLEPIGANGAQAVALMLDAGADRSLIENVDIRGHQDTLFVDAGRSRFRGCTISGSVDFIFGGGRCLIEGCRIVSRYRPGKERQGYVAVPSTQRAQEFGLVLRDCRLEKEAAVPPASVALGRPWRPTRSFTDGRYGDPAIVGAAAFIDCWMDDHIDPTGWDEMSYTARDGSRQMFQPQDARLAEYRSRGPGAHASATRRLLSDDDAKKYTIANMFGDWPA